jgi:hypothetical protein
MIVQQHITSCTIQYYLIKQSTVAAGLLCGSTQPVHYEQEALHRHQNDCNVCKFEFGYGGHILYDLSVQYGYSTM